MSTRAAGPGPSALPADATADRQDEFAVVTAPIVGTFYRQPSQAAPPFVEPGSKVRKGQVLCIIEAMKLMNEIESDVDGVVVEIFPQNAQPVEFGERLFGIKV